eukprot:g5480.t1
MRSGRPLLGDGGAGHGNKNKHNTNNGGGGNAGDGDSFVSRISEYFMRWKVRPDVVLRGRHENKSKGALSAFWQDYKKVRVDWRARAGMRRDHFELALQHYMRIDGPSRDTCEGRIRYIWETRIRDNSHLGVVDVSCQPAKAKVGKRKPSLLTAQKDENAAQRLAVQQQQQQQQQQQHFQRQQQQQAYMQSNGEGGAGAGFSMSGLQQTAPSSGSSRLFSDAPTGAAGGGNRSLTSGRIGPGGSSPGLGGSYDGAGMDDGMPLSGLAPSGGGGSGSRTPQGGDMMFGGQRMDRRGYGEQGVLLRTASGPPLDAAQRAALGGGVVKGEMSRVGGEDESMRKRPRESWSLGDPAGPGLTIKTGRGTGRGSPPSQGPASPAGGLTTPGGKKDRVPNHWWELELTAEGPMLYPTSNCHEWTSDNGIEHRIMEIEFQHGCEVKPPKDRLIKDFTLNWRPNSDIVYVFETEQSGFYGPILGMYEKQTVTHNKMFLYRQMQPQPWPIRDCGWNGGPGVSETTQLRSSWLFNDPCTGQWTIALDYKPQPASPIYQYNVPPECARQGTPCMDLNTFNANSIKVKGCTTLIPPIEVLLLSENSVREVCGAVWVGCFTANPPEVAFDLLCRLMSMTESLHLPDDSDRYAAEVFDAQRAEILAFFLVGICEDPLDRVVRREHYLAFMEWFVYTLPHVALPVKIWRMYRALNDDNIPFVSFPLSQDKSAFYSHRQAMSGPAVPGRFSFRFSRQPSCVTVDYTVQARAVEGRPQATVMSYRIKISAIDVRGVMLRIENLLLRGDGQVAQGRMLEETSLVQGPGAVNNGGGGGGSAGGGSGSVGAGATTNSAAPNGGHHESGLGALGSLERIIAQVDMEESGGSGRQEHTRPPADSSAGTRGGGSSGSGAGGGPAGAATGSGGGWTDMFQGMTVELAQEQAAQLHHGQQRGGGGRPGDHDHHRMADQRQRADGGGGGGGDVDRRGGSGAAVAFSQQHGQPSSYMCGPGGGRMSVQTGDTLSFFDDPPQGNHTQPQLAGGSGPGHGGPMNLEFIEFPNFHELLVFFGRTLTERYDTSREEQETIPSPMYMHNMDE